MLLLFIRIQQKIKHHSYDIVMLEPKSTAEMVSGDNLTESTKSLSALKPTIGEIHDRSEHEKDSPNKTSMKNILYEPGNYMTS